MPADWTPLDDDPVTGTPLRVAMLRLEGQVGEVRVDGVGVGFPAAPVEGQRFLHKGGAQPICYQYMALDGGALGWVAIGPLARIPVDLNLDPDPLDGRAAPFQVKALRAENVAVLPAATPTNPGLVQYRTGDEAVWVSKGDAWVGQMQVVENLSYDTVELPLEGEVGNDAADPPTLVTKGVFRGWLFDAVAEKRTFVVRVPQNWQGATDLRFRLWYLLNQAEAPGDDVEWDGEWRALTPGADKAGQPATVPASPWGTTDIGADPEAIDDGGLHYTDFVIDHDDLTNPVAAGDVLALTINRKTVGGAGLVGGVVAIRAELHFLQAPRHERA